MLHARFCPRTKKQSFSERLTPTEWAVRPDKAKIHHILGMIYALYSRLIDILTVMLLGRVA